MPEAFEGRRRVEIDLDGDLPCDGGEPPGPRRREPCADRLHLGNHRDAPRARCCRAARSPPTSTRWPRCGAGPTPTSSPTGCRCFTSTGWSSGSSARCAAAGRRCTSGASRPRPCRRRSSGPGDDAVRSAHDVPASRRRGRRIAGAGPGAGRRAAARLRVRRAARLRACPPPGADRPRRGGALRDDRDAHEHRHPRRRDAGAGHRGPAAARGRGPAGRRRRRACSTGADDETIGEIQVRGPNLFLEYLNRPDATAEAMHDGWFATGDMATRTAEGYIRIVGRRATDLIKSGGYKIGAGEIEGCLREHPAVEDAAVTGEADDDLGERVVAWIVLRDGATRAGVRAGRPRGRAARPPQAPARRALPRRAAAQRHGQGPEGAARAPSRRRHGSGAAPEGFVGAAAWVRQ